MPRALVVDDSQPNRYLLEVLLQGHGYAVQLASNGIEALAAARQHTPDIIISDIMMPGMDGFTLCRECKQNERLKDIPFVVYTATYTDERDRQLAFSLGADLFLIKPMDPQAFIAEIGTVVAMHADGGLSAQGAGVLSDEGYEREHGQALLRKLDKKVRQLEAANRALAEREALVESVFRAVGVHIAVFGPDGTLTTANREWGEEEATRRPREGPAKSRRCADYLRTRHRREDPEECRAAGGCARCALEQAIQGVLAGGEPVRGLELELEGERGPDRPGRWVIAGIEPVSIEGQRHAVAAFDDITRHKLAEADRERLHAQLLQAQRLEAVGQLAAGVAHDFNNILQGLLSLTTLLRLRAGSSELATTAAEVEVLVRRAAALTQQLLVFSRQRRAERRRLELGELVLGTAEFVRRLLPETIHLAVETAPGLLWVDGDPAQLQQVLVNLALNARDAISHGGAITLRSGATDHEVYFEVSDTGHGIDDGALARIFDPFFTTKEDGKGTGLGLAVARRIVEEHGGRVEVASKPGVGSRFRVVFAAVPPPVLASEEELTASGLPPGDGCTVLVVEDEAIPGRGWWSCWRCTTTGSSLPPAARRPLPAGRELHPTSC